MSAKRSVGDHQVVLDCLWFLLGVVLAALKGRRALVAENLLLRQQLSVTLRAHPHPRIRRRDRVFWVVARRLCADWRRHLVLVQPETVLRWHRRGWRLFWWWRSRRPTGRPRVPQEARALIRRLSEENRLWGTERIRGELLQLNQSHDENYIDHRDGRSRLHLCFPTKTPILIPFHGRQDIRLGLALI